MELSGIVRPVFSLVVALFAIAAWSSDYAFIQIGSPVTSKSFTAHIQGHEVSIYQMVSAIHEMNIPNGRQPVDLWVYFPVVDDSASGHTAFCRQAFDQVQQDQHAIKSGDRLKPYLEINVDPTIQKVTTDEGLSVYQDSGLSCWEAMDPRSAPERGPVY